MEVRKVNVGKRFEVPILAERIFKHRLSNPVPTHDGGWVISFRAHPEVLILDAQLKLLLGLTLGTRTPGYYSRNVAMSRDGNFLALSSRSELLIVDRQGVVL